MVHKTLHSLPPVAYASFYLHSHRGDTAEDRAQLEETRAAMQRYGFTVPEEMEQFADLQDAGAPAVQVLLDVPAGDPAAEHVCEISNGTWEARQHRGAMLDDTNVTPVEKFQAQHIPMSELTGAQLQGQSQDALDANKIAQAAALYYANSLTQEPQHRSAVLAGGDVSAKPALRTDYGAAGPRASKAPQLQAPAEIEWLSEDLLDADWPHEGCTISVENNPVDMGTHVINQWQLSFDTTTGEEITVKEKATGISDSSPAGIVTGFDVEQATYDPATGGNRQISQRASFGPGEQQYQELQEHMMTRIGELSNPTGGRPVQEWLTAQRQIQQAHQQNLSSGPEVG